MRSLGNPKGMETYLCGRINKSPVRGGVVKEKVRGAGVILRGWWCGDLEAGRGGAMVEVP